MHSITAAPACVRRVLRRAALDQDALHAIVPEQLHARDAKLVLPTHDASYPVLKPSRRTSVRNLDAKIYT